MNPIKNTTSVLDEDMLEEIRHRQLMDAMDIQAEIVLDDDFADLYE